MGVLAWLPIAFLLGPCCVQAAPLVIDGFAYTNSAAARRAWFSAGSAPAVTMEASGIWGNDSVMILTCDFATRESRCYWDRSAALKLASYTDFALEVFAPDPGAISAFTLYFRSGSGWYGASAAITVSGWQTLRFSRSEFIAEGTPAGWDRIEGIRLSPWKAAPRNTILAVRELRGFTPPVLLVRDDQSGNPGIVTETIDRHLAWFQRYHVDCGVVTRAGVESGLLKESRLAILPYNETLSDSESTQLERFVGAGGKLMVYYLLPSRISALLGVRRTGWTQGDFAAWSFTNTPIAGLPDRILQDSWNITIAIPDGTINSRIIAQWEDRRGNPTGYAAWIASDHGFFMSHILLGDDADRKSLALLSLVGHLLPEIWSSAASGAIQQIGKVGAYHSYAEAEAGIRGNAESTLRAPLVAQELSAAAADRDRALNELSIANFAQTILAAHTARAHLKEAYFLSLKPVAPEFRAVWDHHATGPNPGRWDTSLEALATNGFTAIFPNMLWGGLAHYNSAWLPHSAEFNAHGDQIAACVSAAHARGLEVHVWKVNWNLSGAPQALIDTLRNASRTQISRDGRPIDWLCPSHPENFTLETNSLLEVVRNYDIDGIHFDYIRYPDSDYCYCPGCGARFQSQTGRAVTQWPADVLTPGGLRSAFLDWRRAQITRLVAAVYAGAKTIKPRVKVSAAVFPDAVSAYDGVGQDWRRWIDEGIVDFLCPMDYTSGLHSFTKLVAQQLAYAKGRVPIYPGIGAHALEADAVLAQIQGTRDARTGGFIVFELSPGTLTGLLPAIHAGATAPDEPDTDEDFLPDSWENRSSMRRSEP